jgi:hypothetical protein
MEWSPITTAFQEKLEKVWLGIAFILVAALAFEAGWLKQSLHETRPLIITAPAAIEAAAAPVRQAAAETKTPAPTVSPQEDGAANTCVFVGSKKSNKYHVPTSRCAKQIKNENRLCFTSGEAAAAKGYLPGCLE